jgi:thiol:disulfide interchange protein
MTSPRPFRSRRALDLLVVLALAVTVAVTLLSPAAARADDLEWLKPSEENQSRAVEQDTPILYYFTASWCVPCHRLKKDVFDAERGHQIATWYLPVEAEDTVYEKGKNTPAVAELIRRYRVVSFPTLVVAEPDGAEIAQLEGYPGAARVWRFLETHKGPLQSPATPAATVAAATTAD